MENINNLSQASNNNICEECEDEQAILQCSSCGQVLCENCDKKIHNKGKRILHQRNYLNSGRLKTENSNHSYSNLQDVSNNSQNISQNLKTQKISKQSSNNNNALQNQNNNNQNNNNLNQNQNNQNIINNNSSSSNLHINNVSSNSQKNLNIIDDFNNMFYSPETKQSLNKSENLGEKHFEKQQIGSQNNINQGIENKEYLHHPGHQNKLINFNNFFEQQQQLQPQNQQQQLNNNNNNNNNINMQQNNLMNNNNNNNILQNSNQNNNIFQSSPYHNTANNNINNMNNYVNPLMSDIMGSSAKKSEVIQSVSFIDMSLDQQNRFMGDISMDQQQQYNGGSSSNNQNSNKIIQQSNSATNLLNTSKSSNVSGTQNNNNNNNANNIPVNPIQIQVLQMFNFQKYTDDQLEELVLKQLVECANQGELLVKLEGFKVSIKKMQEVSNNNSQNNNYSNNKQIDRCIKKLDGKAVHLTTRKFGDGQPIQYISLKLESISFQSIQWILKSIRNDEMTPKEQLVLSRIKESYALKLNQLVWNGILLYIKNQCDSDNLIKFKEPEMETFQVQRNIDLMQNQEQIMLYLNDEVEWKVGDTGPITEQDQPLWVVFIDFLKEFFEESQDNQDLKKGSSNTSNSSYNNNNNYVQTNNSSSQNNNSQNNYSNNHNNTSNNNNSSKANNWTSSVETVLTKGAKKTLVRPPKSINKAIPGGRYGCAQLLKCCGPAQLKDCSMGKLSLFVQEAINKGVLSYYRTLLIKPNNVDFNEVYDLSILDQSINASNTEEKMSREQLEKISKLKFSIIEILKENKKGVSLAKLPKMIKKRINFPLDLHELGFPKLKSFLVTIDGVEIDKDSSTRAQAIYKPQNLSLVKQSNNNLQSFNVNRSYNQRDLSPMSYNKRFSTLKYENQQQKYQNFNGRTLSNLDDYANRVHQILQQIVNEQKYGILSSKLYEQLSQKLNGKFEFSLFSCQSFNEFLSRYTEGYLEIMIKQSNYVVYPKNYKFQQNFFQFNQKQPSFGQQQFQQQQQQYVQQMQQQQQQMQQQQQQQQQQQLQQQDEILYNNFNTQNQTDIFQAELSSIGNYSQCFTNFQPFQNQEESQNELQDQYKFIEELLQEDDNQQGQNSNNNINNQSKNQMQNINNIKKPKSNDFYNMQNKQQHYQHRKSNFSGNFDHYRKYSPLYLNNNLPEINEEKNVDINSNHQQYQYQQQQYNNKSFSVNDQEQQYKNQQNKKNTKTKTMNFEQEQY